MNRTKLLSCVFLILTISFSNVLLIHAHEDLESTDAAFDDMEDYDPRTREVYDSYSRDGLWSMYVNGNAYEATNRTGNKFYIPELNTRVTGDGNFTEIYDITPQQYETYDSRIMYKVPWEFSKFSTGYTLAPGTYTAYKSSYNWVWIETNDGHKGWIDPSYVNMNFVGKKTGKYTNTNSKLSVDAVRNIPIYQDILNVKENQRPGSAMVPRFVTIHNTANEGYGANARAHAQLQHRNNWTSWHYTVDNNEIYQSIPMDEISYHAGDGVSMGNGATISIEICENSDGNYSVAEKNAALLTARLLYENNLPADAVKMHKDWSGKHCAHNILDMTKGSMGWSGFKNAVVIEYNKIVSENEALNTTPPAGSEIYIDNAKLTYLNNVLSGFPLNTDVVNAKQQLLPTGSTSKITIKDAQGNEKNSGVLKTNDIILIEEDIKKFEFRIAMKGDANGDGKISALDYVAIENNIMGNKTLNGAYKIASDVNGDKKVTALDYVRIENHIMGVKPIK